MLAALAAGAEAGSTVVADSAAVRVDLAGADIMVAVASAVMAVAGSEDMAAETAAGLVAVAAEWALADSLVRVVVQAAMDLVRVVLVGSAANLVAAIWEPVAWVRADSMAAAVSLEPVGSMAVPAPVELVRAVTAIVASVLVATGRVVLELGRVARNSTVSSACHPTKACTI